MKNTIPDYLKFDMTLLYIEHIYDIYFTLISYQVNTIKYEIKIA